jgi:hypothetical protein
MSMLSRTAGLAELVLVVAMQSPSSVRVRVTTSRRRPEHPCREAHHISPAASMSQPHLRHGDHATCRLQHVAGDSFLLLNLLTTK